MGARERRARCASRRDEVAAADTRKTRTEGRRRRDRQAGGRLRASSGTPGRACKSSAMPARRRRRSCSSAATTTRPARRSAPASRTCSAAAPPDMIPAARRPDSSGRRLAFARWLTAPGTPADGLVLRVPRQPRLAAPLRQGHRRDRRQLRRHRRPADAPRAARLAGRRVPRRRPAPQAAAPRCCHVRGVPPGRPASLRRLESEAIRDALLAVGGKLDRRVGGPPSRPSRSPTAPFRVQARPTAQFRRSLYLLARRNYHPTLLSVFDQPMVATNCTRRKPSAVVLQSLTMLNDAFVLRPGRPLRRPRQPRAGDDPAARWSGRSASPCPARRARAKSQWCREYLEPPRADGAVPHAVNASEVLYAP